MAPLDQITPVAQTDCDVFVVGGGPGGSTIAAILAERGHRVVLAEKDQHPRFHVGESLLPHNLPLLDRLGVRQQIEETSIQKYGIEFVSAAHGKSVMYNFADALDKRFPYSFQVRRSTFDHLLLKNAAAKGAEVIENCRVTAVTLDDGEKPRIEAKDKDGQLRRWRASFLVDASGRDTLMASKLSLKARNPRNQSAAIFGHFAGAHRLPGKFEGNITIAWFENGWFWFIPLSDGTTSIGAVCPAAFFKDRGTDLPSFFQSVIASCPEIAARLKDAHLVGPVIATGNYSYGAKRASGPNFIMVGDAYEFIDPVFSTGVYLAMTMAFHGADTVEACLRNPRHSERTLQRYEAAIQRALGPFIWFVYRIREPAMRNLFMSPRNTLRMEEVVLALLAGDTTGGWIKHSRIALFKLVYYITKLGLMRHRLFRPGQAPPQAPAKGMA